MKWAQMTSLRRWDWVPDWMVTFSGMATRKARRERGAADEADEAE